MADDARILKAGYSFTKLNRVTQLVGEQRIDVVGIVMDEAPSASLTLKDGRTT